MALEYLSELSINQFISLALSEDAPEGDHTSLACIPDNETGKSEVIAKDSGIVAGVNLAERIFIHLNPEGKVEVKIKDGESINQGDIIMRLEGQIHALLLSERLILNCMQRMSAIATKTKKLVDAIGDHKATLLDTRKTTPLFRMMEKWAVVIGGGKNHRYNLSDQIMIKDNHIDYSGSVMNAIIKVNDYLKTNQLDKKIIVEVRNKQELEKVLSCGGVDRILLDNMTPEELKDCVELVGGTYQTEASGGIDEKNITAIAASGVDFISIGAVTHSYHSLDISMKAV